MTSVNTNYGAMIALQQLNKTNMELAETQTRINTGLKVSGAKDNGAIYAIAQGMRGDVASYGVVKQSLDRSISTVDTAIAAGEAISDLLVEMKEKALAASDATLSAEQSAAYNEDFKSLRDQIKTVVANAEFNGSNLIDGSTQAIRALANASGSSTISIASQDLSLTSSGTVLTISSAAVISTAAQATSMIAKISASLVNLNKSLARLGTGSKSLEVHSTFVTKLSDAMEKGIGNLVDADLAKESAKLQALQTKQQLGVQALSIANQSSSLALSFFR